MVSLDVADDGTGFDPTTAGRHGFGLNTMRHRAEMLGGTLHIDTETEEGSTINASIPIPPPESANTMIRIVIVDDHPLCAPGARTRRRTRHRRCRRSPRSWHRHCHDHDLAPDVVLLDVHLGPGASGLDVLDHLQASSPSPRVLVVTVFDNDIDIDTALARGASGYILKDAPEDELINAVRAVAAGHQPLDPRVAARVATRSLRSPEMPSPRELEVLAAVADGHDNATIARRLYISQATVKTHLASAFTKLGVSTRTGAVAEARRRGHLR